MNYLCDDQVERSREDADLRLQQRDLHLPRARAAHHRLAQRVHLGGGTEGGDSVRD